MVLSFIFAAFFIYSVTLFFNVNALMQNTNIKFLELFRITYYETAPNAITSLELIFILFCFIFIIYLLIRNYKENKNNHIRWIFISLILYFVSFINDSLVYIGFYKFFYTTEYSFMLMILAMADYLLHKYVDLKEKISIQLYTDMLTSMPNRRKLLSEMENTEHPFLVLINIDSFKEINDFYGNDIGDFVLMELSKRLKNLSFQNRHQIFKMHGDEYAILMDMEIIPEETAKKTWFGIIHYIFEEINDHNFKYQDIEINIRVTIGVSYYNPDINENGDIGLLKSKVLNNADMALKHAKKLGKSFLVYDNSMQIHKEFENNLFWTKKIKEAINNDRIKPFFQPIINNSTGKIEKYECLVRMLDGDGKLIGPYQFLGISQKVRLYNKITATMLRKSFNTFAGTDYEFSINLSVNDILNEETNRLIHTILKQNELLAPHVVFEILESEGISNYDIMSGFIHEIREYRCKFAIDDFGSGYSNFDHIIKLNVDYIKIDASIIKNLDQDSNLVIIARMIAEAARALGISTIAEFVHSEAVFLKCKEIGFDYSQGYYFSEPKENIDR